MTTELPDDIEQLKQMLAKLQHENQVLSSKNIDLEQLKLNRKKEFGSRSEKMPKGTFNEAEENESESKTRVRKGRKALPEHLEREEKSYVIDTPTCVCCGHGMHECGEQISEQVKIIPEKISVIKHRQTKYTCRECEATSISSSVVTAPKPAQPIPSSIASPEALAAVVVTKYCDALPLYRLTDILARGGLEITRGTLANWCIKSAALLSPLIAAMKIHLLAQSTLCADETTIQVLDEKDRTAQQKSYMWVYRSNEYTPKPVVIYDYQPSRARRCPETFLAGYAGYLQCDGYSAYENIDDIIPVGCWAHARRKFHDVLVAQPKKTGKATVGLNYIQSLYAIEKNDVLVLDRGYFSYLVISKAMEKGLHLICRMQNGNVNKEVNDFWLSDRVDDIITYTPSLAVKYATEKRDYNVTLTPIKLRLIKYVINDETYVCSTTLLEDKYSISAFSKAYHARWGIEELYKISKEFVGLEDFHSHSERGVLQECYAHILMINIARIFESEAIKKLPTEFSDDKEPLEPQDSYWKDFCGHRLTGPHCYR